jgi:hypothetical protein
MDASLWIELRPPRQPVAIPRHDDDMSEKRSTRDASVRESLACSVLNHLDMNLEPAVAGYTNHRWMSWLVTSSQISSQALPEIRLNVKEAGKYSLHPLTATEL